MQIALCQFNPVVGAIRENAERLLSWAHRALQQEAELVVFPELALCGYPPKDLVFLPDFHQAVQSALKSLAERLPLPAILGAPTPKRCNAAYFCFQGEAKPIAFKRLLPNYQVFDEARYFVAGSAQQTAPFSWKGKRLGVHICEDAWSEVIGYSENPLQDLALQNCDAWIHLCASPYETGKPAFRQELFRKLAIQYAKPFAVAGQVGGNDGLIFDGGSMVFGASGQILWMAQPFEEHLGVFSC
ncbi:MAG: hypothetical protein I8H75_06295 [Myxococcaceae bacterium]|nr:hypothetical protein [Myxococcaceae bacterium]